MKRIYVLVACEESQVMCRAFRSKGCIAYSCDIQSCAPSAYPKWHIKQDVAPLLDGQCDFHTMDGRYHRVPGWTLIIAHPPCTYICKVSSVHMHKQPLSQVNTRLGRKMLNKQRYDRLLDAVRFFYVCLNAKAQFVAVENPIPMKLAGLPRPSCYVDPSQFGHKYTKKTLLWLKNLPPILPTIFYPNPREFVRASRGKYRARTFEGVANACAAQWVPYIKSQL